MNRRVEISTPLGKMLSFRSMHGDEALSTLFEFEVDMVAETAQLDLKQLLSQPVTIRIASGFGQYRYLNGQVARCRMVGNYRKWEYGVQYEESDFAFISRLMEHEGMYYWFRHEDGVHTLVISDDMAQHEPFPGLEDIPYYGPDRVAVTAFVSRMATRRRASSSC